MLRAATEISAPLGRMPTALAVDADFLVAGDKEQPGGAGYGWTNAHCQRGGICEGAWMTGEPKVMGVSGGLEGLRGMLA